MYFIPYSPYRNLYQFCQVRIRAQTMRTLLLSLSLTALSSSPFQLLLYSFSQSKHFTYHSSVKISRPIMTSLPPQNGHITRSLIILYLPYLSIILTIWNRFTFTIVVLIIEWTLPFMTCAKSLGL